jgi:branched-chain amino acid transport system permease protein
MEIFGIPLQAFLGQLLLGLVNGAFYALLSLGLAVIFGLLGIVNFAHGALYMLGAFAAWIMLDKFGLNYWYALVLAPLAVGLLGVVIERLFLKHLYKLDPIYGLLLTFGLALIFEGVFRELYGASGQNYNVPELLQGATNLGFMILPNYRAWVVLVSLVVCLGTWFLIERTRLGAYLRAGTENAPLLQTFGVNVPVMVMCTYGAGAALRSLAPLPGVLLAPIRSSMFRRW